LNEFNYQSLESIVWHRDTGRSNLSTRSTN